MAVDDRSGGLTRRMEIVPCRLRLVACALSVGVDKLVSVVVKRVKIAFIDPLCVCKNSLIYRLSKLSKPGGPRPPCQPLFLRLLMLTRFAVVLSRYASGGQKTPNLAHHRKLSARSVFLPPAG